MDRKTSGSFPVKSMDDLQGLGRSMKWQWFERLVAWVFEQNGFDVSVGVVETGGGSKRQYDVIAEGPRFAFAADCKRWTGNHCKTSQAKLAAEDQTERCFFLSRCMGKEIVPVIVTLCDENIRIHDGVPVVPVELLNTFINTWEGMDEDVKRLPPLVKNKNWRRK